MTDCKALGAFAYDSAAYLGGFAGDLKNQFAGGFGVFVNLKDPSVAKYNEAKQKWGFLLGANTIIGGISNPVVMLQGMPGATSGFAAGYQDSINRTNPDQVHHFAAYFQLGYSAGGLFGSAVALYHDLSPPNPGDILLGTVAAQMGADVRSGKLSMFDVVAEIAKLSKK